MNELSLLAINLTRRCNLACPHCYLDADSLNEANEEELGTYEACDLLAQVAKMGYSTMVVLTGGEPLVRQDLEQIARYGVDLGLPVVVGTNGVMLNRKRVQAQVIYQTQQAPGLRKPGVGRDGQSGSSSTRRITASKR